MIGDDQEGIRLSAALAGAGLDPSGLVTDPARPTTRKTRVLADGAHQVLRIDHEQTFPLETAVEERLIAQLNSRIASCDAVLLSDYRKGTLTSGAIKEVIAQARASGKHVVANAKPDGLGNYRGASLVSLNQFEAAQASGRGDLLDMAQNRSPQLHSVAQQIAQQLQEREGIDHVLVTLRGDGMVTAEYSIEPVRVEVSDEAGAGDTTIASVTLGLAALGYCADIFHLAAQTSAAVVQKIGLPLPTRETWPESLSDQFPHKDLGYSLSWHVSRNRFKEPGRELRGRHLRAF